MKGRANDYVRKQYPKLRLVVFSASCLSPATAARYVYWSLGSYLSLRDSEREIRGLVEAVFGKRQAVPSYLRKSVEEYGYGRLSGIMPYLTHREIEIIRFAAEEKILTEMASFLLLSWRTVQCHISNICDKFGIHNIVGVLKLTVAKGNTAAELLLDLYRQR